MKTIITAALLTAFSTAVLADSVVVTETKTWKSVPITVDSSKHTYTLVDTTAALPDGDYYYSYAGYRCFKEKRTVVGVDAEVLTSSVAGGTDIYCYPE